MKRLDSLEAAVRRTIEAGAASSDSRLWTHVQRAADLFMEEGRATIRSGRPPSSAFYQRHQNLLAAIADLASSSFSPNGAVLAERERLSSRIRYSLILLGIAVLVAILGAVFTVYFVNRMFLRLRWQAAELTDLSSRTMADQEDAASRLSREMHDHFGQTLSAIEANLVAMQNARAFHPGRLEDGLGLVKDAVENVREISQLLRPSILDDFGLNDSLRWLADSFGERTGIGDALLVLVHRPSGWHRRDAVVPHRAGSADQCRASRQRDSRSLIELAHVKDVLRLTVSDNGRGMGLHTGDHRNRPRRNARAGACRPRHRVGRFAPGRGRPDSRRGPAPANSLCSAKFAYS